MLASFDVTAEYDNHGVNNMLNDALGELDLLTACVHATRRIAESGTYDSGVIPFLCSELPVLLPRSP